MKLKSRLFVHTEGAMTAEACVCSSAVIIIFALFLTIAGYCSCYFAVKSFIDEKARETSAMAYATGIYIPGVVSPAGLADETARRMKNLIIYHGQSGGDIYFIASYKYRSLFGDFGARVRSGFTKWEGDGRKDGERPVWELPANERGKKLEEIFGGGLPEYFPVIDGYDHMTGKAVAIVSIDITLDVYQSGNELKKLLYEKIDELADFRQGACDGFSITEKDIDGRELLVVIPENAMNRGQSDSFAECARHANARGIAMVVKRYQKAPEKVIASDDE
ncbi:MAG: hypothetical protein JXB33_00600 [Clostridia bacterium]|nr:hypothetical protein [Clostridia bacterium]